MAKKMRDQRSATAADVELGQRIRLRRVEIDMTQQELAAALGVSFQQVQKYEKGVNRIGVTRLQQIADALKTPASFFYNAHNKKELEVESLLFGDAQFSLRLLRAYNAIEDDILRRNFVVLMERVAGTGG